jgi:hypothetical protein
MKVGADVVLAGWGDPHEQIPWVALPRPGGLYSAFFEGERAIHYGHYSANV